MFLEGNLTNFQVYNNLVLGSADAIVAGLPRIPNTERNQYIRYELEYTLWWLQYFLLFQK